MESIASALLVALSCTSRVAEATEALSLSEAITLAQGRRSEQAEAQTDVALAGVGLLRAATQRAQLSIDVSYADRYSRPYVAPSMCGAEPMRCVLDRSARSVDGVAGLTVPVWSGWSIESNWQRARTLESAARAQNAAIARQLAIEATRAYWTVRQIDLLLEVSRKASQRNDEIVAITKARSTAGISPIVDYTRSQTRSLRQRANIAALVGQAAQARAQLAAALQVDDDITLVDEPPEELPLLPPLERLLADAQSARPEVVAARAQTEAQRLQVRSIDGALWPQINRIRSANRVADGSDRAA